MLRLLILLIILNLMSSKKNFEWRDLTYDEINDWYSPFDICMMNTSDYYKSPQEIKRTHCINKDTRIRGKPGFCRVGMGSNKKECSSPYSGRLTYRKGVDGYTDASSSPLIEAFKVFADTNTALVFLGDSTMTQKRLALNCELLRENHKMKINGSKTATGVLPCHSKESVKIPGIDQFIDVHGVSFGPSSLTCLGDPKKLKHATAKDIYSVAEKVLNKINYLEGKNMFIIANMGLWFNSKTLMTNRITPALQWLNGLSEIPNFKNHIFWHETMSQHWPNADNNGYFNQGLGKAHYKQITDEKWLKNPIQFQVPGCCVAIQNFSEQADWRNELIKENIIKNNLNNIKTIPFADITKGAADMHLCSPLAPKQDCTHYCYWPLLWQQFWHTIKKYAEEIVK